MVRRPRKERIPEHLPVVEEVLEPEPEAGGPFTVASDRTGSQRAPRLRAGRFFRRRLVRPRYVRKVDKDAAPIIAPLPQRLRERSLPAAGLLAHVLVSKYCDHLPCTDRNGSSEAATAWSCPAKLGSMGRAGR